MTFSLSGKKGIRYASVSLILVVQCFTCPLLVLLLFRNQRKATGIFQLMQNLMMNQKEDGCALPALNWMWFPKILQHLKAHETWLMKICSFKAFFIPN
ncbi:hypothetical protein AAZX31_01G116800 [Glycine max]